MRRLLVYLTEGQHRKLAALANSLHVSKAQLIREGVDLLLRREAGRGKDPLLDLVGQAGPMGQSHPTAQHDSDQSSLFADTERTSRIPPRVIGGETRPQAARRSPMRRGHSDAANTSRAHRRAAP